MKTQFAEASGYSDLSLFGRQGGGYPPKNKSHPRPFLLLKSLYSPVLPRSVSEIWKPKFLIRIEY